MSGWIIIDRSIQDHWINKQDRVYSEFEAWIDILLSVNHSEKKTKIKSTIITVNRGESIYSLETWGKRWKWDKNRVRRFLKILEKENAIELKSERITTRLTVCNYDSYQSKRNTTETQLKRKRNATETQLTPREINNSNNTKVLLHAFDGFWQYYGKKRDKKRCLEKWMKVVTLENIDHIRHSLKIYIDQTKDNVKFRKDPLTWLNGNCWLDYEMGEQPKKELPRDIQPITLDY